MSGSEGSDGEMEERQEIVYKCKYCPEMTFTAAEKDNHRLMHKQQRRRARMGSPTPTDVTIFEEIPTTPVAARTAGKRPRGRRPGPASAKRGRPASEKIKSTKKFDREVVHQKTNGA